MKTLTAINPTQHLLAISIEIACCFTGEDCIADLQVPDTVQVAVFDKLTFRIDDDLGKAIYLYEQESNSNNRELYNLVKRGVPFNKARGMIARGEMCNRAEAKRQWINKQGISPRLAETLYHAGPYCREPNWGLVIKQLTPALLDAVTYCYTNNVSHSEFKQALGNLFSVEHTTRVRYMAWCKQLLEHVIPGTISLSPQEMGN